MIVQTMERRKVLGILLLSSAAPLLFGRSSFAADEQPIQFEWRVPIVHKETVKSSLVFEGDVTEEEGTKGISLVLIFAGAILIPYLANSIIDLRNKIVRGGGVKIDARGEQVKIEVDPALDRGVIVVVGKDGVNLYREEDDLPTASDLTDLLKVVLK